MNISSFPVERECVGKETGRQSTHGKMELQVQAMLRQGREHKTHRQLGGKIRTHSQGSWRGSTQTMTSQQASRTRTGEYSQCFQQGKLWI